MHHKYRTRSPTNCACLLTALIYKLLDLLHKIHFLTALKTLDTTYKQRLVGERIRYVYKIRITERKANVFHGMNFKKTSCITEINL